jgi:NAD(P)-dependent dehydrogenase (short-subunit alcohol dehydrogenase family)
METEMSGKTIVVTGAFGTLGRAVVTAALAKGHKVGAVDVAIPGQNPFPQANAFAIDLTDLSVTTEAMHRIKEQTGRIDALLNIAGGFAWQTVADGDPKVWDKMFALNLKTAYNASKGALQHLIEAKGAIVNVGANGALNAGAGMGAYAASKAGVHKLTESLAQELKGKVRVNAVLPSIIDTVPEPRRHAEGRLLDLGEAARPRERDALLGLRRSSRHHRCAPPRDGPGVTPAIFALERL